jgi:HSP20 family molecular chaperone IbpA
MWSSDISVSLTSSYVTISGSEMKEKKFSFLHIREMSGSSYTYSIFIL